MALMRAAKSSLNLRDDTRTKLDAMETAMVARDDARGYRRADEIHRAQDFMAMMHKKKARANAREAEWHTRNTAREAAVGDTAASALAAHAEREEYKKTIDDAVVDAAQFHVSLTKDDGDVLLRRVARRDPMRTVRIPAESELRPKLFSFKPLYDHPLRVGHGRFENDQAMRALSLLPAKWRCRTAAIQNKPWCIEELYMTGFKCDLPDAQGWTPLHLACSRGHVECVNALIHIGVDVNAQTVASVTPLYMACAANSVGSAQLLRAAGAHLEIVDVPHGAYEGHRTILDIDVLGHVPRVRRAVDDRRENLSQFESGDRYSTGTLAHPALQDMHNINPR